MEKKTARLRRAKKTRAHIRRLGMPRLTVHRSGRHIYAQIIAAESGTVIAAASTVQKDLRVGLKSTSNKEAAKAVGKAVDDPIRKNIGSELTFPQAYDWLIRFPVSPRNG